MSAFTSFFPFSLLYLLLYPLSSLWPFHPLFAINVVLSYPMSKLYPLFLYPLSIELFEDIGASSVGALFVRDRGDRSY